MSAAPSIEFGDERCFHCARALDESNALDTVHGSIGDDVHGFCCHGCLGAAELIHELGLEGYYERREAPPPETGRDPDGADPALDRFDDVELQRSFVHTEPDGSLVATLDVRGMRCAACSWLLEERLGRLRGLHEAHFGLAQQRARVRWDPDELRLSQILNCIAALGYRAAPFEPDRYEELIRAERRTTLRRLGVAGLGTMQVMMFSVALYAGAFGDLETWTRDLLRLASALVTTPVLAYAGWPFLASAWRDVRATRVGAEVPIALALLVAWTASLASLLRGEGEVYFDSICMFIFFLTLARAVERDLRARSELRIRRLMARVPSHAHRLEGTTLRDVPLTSVAVGDVLELRPGETVPADGVVISGSGGIGEALLTGEAAPVLKHAGDVVVGGSQNFDGTLRIRIERVGPASTLQQIATLLDRAQLEKPPMAALADRVARVFLACILAVAAAVALYWVATDATRAVPVVVAVLIATCPCALSLAAPAAIAAATHGLAERGLLITRGHALEALARVDRIVFDKTGTLTETTPTLEHVEPLAAGVDAATTLRLAAALEGSASHPLARAVRAAAGSSALPAVTDRESVAGYGVSGIVEGKAVRLGEPSWSLAAASKPTVDHAGAASPGTQQDDAGSRVLLANEDGPLAAFYFSTRPRADAAETVARLERSGLACALVSGDPDTAQVRALAERLGLDEAHADASPEGKLRILDSWIAGGDTVLAVGDGINDAPLLGHAQVSLAMGSGSDLARLQADAVILDDRLASIPLALRWAHRSRNVMRQNYAWAIGYNASVLPLAAAGLLPPWLAALGMSLSSLIVVGNSLRLRRLEPGPSR